VFLRSNKDSADRFLASLRSIKVTTFLLVICLSGCGSSEFGGDSIKGMLEGTPLNLTSEQVTLTDSQLECGAKNDLWDTPNGNVARLTQKGRDLKFTDDIRVNDPEIHAPYTQVSGTFPVSVSDVSKLRDDDRGMKLADVKIGVVITHECFTAPLPLMGVRKGKFTPEAPVVFRFQGSGKEWTLDKVVH
jgi:hypothetical protein